jgi:hypothetical protein
MTAFQPINPTGEFPYFGYDGPPPEPLFNRISLDPLFNRLSYVIQAAHQSYYDFPRDRMRAKLLGLRSRKRSGFSKNARGEPIPALHAYSPVISPRPGDWPETTTVTGFWRLDEVEVIGHEVVVVRRAQEVQQVVARGVGVQGTGGGVPVGAGLPHVGRVRGHRVPQL